MNKVLDFILQKEVIGPVVILVVSMIGYKIIKKLLRKFIDLRSKKVDQKKKYYILFIKKYN